MTIKVERDALLRVLQREPCCYTTSSSSDAIGNDSGDVVLVDLCESFSSRSYPVKPVRESTQQDDDDSIFTLSTASLSSDDSSAASCDDELPKRVTFADTLVTEVWTRPYTQKDSGLYYTVEETTKFRQEYRLERKLMSELAIDPEVIASEDDCLSQFISTSSQPRGRHSISRVVVLHNDKLETFTSPEDSSPCTQLLPSLNCSSSCDDFFDNDSFWSGSITWY